MKKTIWRPNRGDWNRYICSVTNPHSFPWRNKSIIFLHVKKCEETVVRTPNVVFIESSHQMRVSKKSSWMAGFFLLSLPTAQILSGSGPFGDIQYCEDDIYFSSYLGIFCFTLYMMKKYVEEIFFLRTTYMQTRYKVSNLNHCVLCRFGEKSSFLPFFWT
jgi:hypothetical protein